MLLESYPLDLSVMANPFPFFESSVNLSVLANFANSRLKTRLSKLYKIHAAMYKLLVAQARKAVQNSRCDAQTTSGTGAEFIYYRRRLG